MTKNDWIVQIDTTLTIYSEAGSATIRGIIREIKAETRKDPDLRPDDLLALEQYLEIKFQELCGDDKEPVQEKSIKALPINYNFIAESFKIEKGVSKFNPGKKPYAKWLCEDFFPSFFPLPYGDLQYKIITSLALLNCNAGLVIEGEEVSKFPIGLSLGLQGSGKSQCVEQIAKHYPAAQRVEALPSWTGASMRDAMHVAFGGGQPGIFILDNFNPSLSLGRIGHHYSMVLANDREKATSRISTKGSDVEGDGIFITHCFKWITSIFDLESAPQDECKEILRRCITLCHTPNVPEQTWIGYSWSEMEDEYYKIWSDIPALRESYFPTLVDLMKLPPRSINFPSPSYWEICQIPIAVGVHLGLWSHIMEGVDHFRSYFDELPKMKQNTVKDLFVTIVDQFMNKYYPGLVRANPDDFSLDEIPLDQIKNYIQRHGLNVTSRDIREVIPKLLSDYGYVVQTEGAISFVRKST